MDTFKQYFSEVRYKFVRDAARGNKKEVELNPKSLETLIAENPGEKHSIIKNYKLGLGIEREHTNDEYIIKRTVLQHMAERLDYYTAPKEKNWAEKELESES